ncbi:hypothetical protein AN958_04754 [Leucoagaricus sp. SymC.cos]|nr:hypothetical protein AN958_04754 [Leucoagaricus sp. SymC.cos]
MILGLPWLQQHNPDINWENCTLQWRQHPWKQKRFQELVNLMYEDNHPIEINDMSYLEPTGQDFEEINFKTSASIFLDQQFKAKQQDDPKKAVPPEYHDFLKVFNKKASERYPPPHSWDHKIETRPFFSPISMKSYQLLLKEEQELKAFLKENPEKGYIKLSKSPMVSPFFFVAKKDGKL